MKKKISIVIPCYNEEEHIGECLDSIINQIYPSELIEVIIIDGKSSDKTVEVIEQYTDYLKNITIMTNLKKYTPISLNIGIKEAKGDYIAILGGHSYIENNFINYAVEELDRTDAVCVGGSVINKGKYFIGNAIALAMQSRFGVGNSGFRVSSKTQYVDTVAFGMYRRDIFSKIGYFDETLIRNQDFEFNQRIIQNGGKLLLVPKIQSYYYNRTSLIKLFKQYFFYGFWKVRVVTKNFITFKLRYQIPFIFVLIILALSIGGFFNPYLWTYLIFLITLYFSFSILNAISICIKSNIKYIPIMPIIFFILHLSFGLGFLIGLGNNLLFIKK